MLYFTLTTIGLTVLLIISGFSFKSVLERKQKKTKKQKRRKNTRYEQLHQESDSEDNYKVFLSFFFKLKIFVHRKCTGYGERRDENSGRTRSPSHWRVVLGITMMIMTVTRQIHYSRWMSKNVNVSTCSSSNVALIWSSRSHPPYTHTYTLMILQQS